MAPTGNARPFQTRPAEGGSGPALEIADPGGRLTRAKLDWVRSAATRGAALLARGGEVRVLVVGDAEMAAAHERYQGIAGTTDVLTFDLSEAPPEQSPVQFGHPAGRVLDTDILACADEAARQGAARGHAQERELLLYILHGLLHCLGHDDHDETAAARMHAVEDAVLEALGVGATFARGREAGAQPGGGP